jgi:hypothetical protein
MTVKRKLTKEKTGKLPKTKDRHYRISVGKTMPLLDKKWGFYHEIKCRKPCPEILRGHLY